MRVAVNLLGLPSLHQGGAGFQAAILLRELDARDDVDVVVLCHPQVAGELDGLERSRVEIAAPRRLASPAGAASALRSVRRPSAFGGHGELAHALARCDLVHYPLGFMSGPAHALPATVLAVDLQHLAHPGFFSRRDRALRRLRWHPALRAADRIQVFTGFVRDSIADRFGRRDAIDVVGASCDPGFFAPPAGPADAPPGAPADAAGFLLYPASPLPAKNHPRLLAAFARVAAERPGLRLVLCGPRLHDWSAVHAAAAASGVAERIGFLDHVRLADLRARYRGARALIFPSLYEGFGMPLLEAMASGCPVAASDSASVPEVLGGAGLGFDPRSEAAIAAAMRRVLDLEPAERERLIARGHARALELTPAALAERTVASWRRAASARR